MHVAVASDGGSGLALARAACAQAHPFDLAIVDHAMPGEDGKAVIQALRADTDPRMARLPAILLTSAGQRGDARAFADMGYDGYLPKPIMASALHQVISVVLGQAEHGARDLPGPAPALVTRHLVEEMRGERPAAGALSGRVLLVEDVAVNRKYALAMLHRLGVQADVAGNGEEALARYGERAYALILMDCQMPVMDGYTATRAIRERERAEGLARTTIVALTAHDIHEERQRCLDAGMDEFMSKPFKRDEFEALMQRCLTAAPAADEAAPDSAIPAPDADWSASSLAPEVIDEMRRDYPDDFAEMLESFSMSLRDLAGAIRLARGPDASNSLSAHAHSLKSAAGAFGARSLERMARELEHDAGTLAVTERQARIDALLDECTRVLVEVESMASRLGGTGS